MNRLQKITLILGLLILAVSTVYPPWIIKSGTRYDQSSKRQWLAFWNAQSGDSTIDFNVLKLEWLATSVLTVGVILLLHVRRAISLHRPTKSFNDLDLEIYIASVASTADLLSLNEGERKVLVKMLSIARESYQKKNLKQFTEMQRKVDAHLTMMNQVRFSIAANTSKLGGNLDVQLNCETIETKIVFDDPLSLRLESPYPIESKVSGNLDVQLNCETLESKIAFENSLDVQLDTPFPLQAEVATSKD